MGKILMLILGGILGTFFFVGNSQALPIANGNFSIGLDGWTQEGDVSVNNSDEAVLSDENDWYSLLYQGVALSPSTYTIEFDFQNNLSGTIPDDNNSAFSDTFYASLYFIKDMDSFNLDELVNYEACSLFNMDYFGVFDDDGNSMTTNGTLSSSSKGDGWTHFSYTFQTVYDYAIPIFELYDFNFIDSDSRILIDNVSIAPVPEPATIVLLGTGLVSLVSISRRRRRS